MNGLQQQNIIDIVGKNYLALRIESLFAERGTRIRNIMVSLFNLFFQIHNIQQLKSSSYGVRMLSGLIVTNGER